MSATVDQLSNTLISSGVLSADDLTKLWAALPAEARPTDAAALAKLLVERGKLTAFQAKEILAGRAAKLVLNEYLILDEIGAGGMGKVYKAQHRRMQRTVALKVMSAAAMKDEASVKRFQREVRAAARLEHPNIVVAYSSGESGAVKYLVMQFVDGGDLSSLVKKGGPLPIEQAVDFIIQAARGLAYAHGEGVIHRDIKPANLLVDKKGVVKILDMGLARIESSDDGLTATEQVMGTVDYMSPEQASNTKGADARADVYSLGCTFWYVLTGKKLYEGESMISRLMAHRDAPLPSLVKTRDDAPWALEQILHRMVAKRAEDRFQTMDEIVAALAPFAPSGGGAAPMGSSIGHGSSSHNAELAAFMQNAPITAVQSKDPSSKSHVTLAATTQFSSPDVGTASHLAAQPASARSAGSRGQAPRLNKKSPLVPILAGGGLVVVAAIAWLAMRGGEAPAQPVAATAAAVVSPPAGKTPVAVPPPPAAPAIVISEQQGAAVAEKLESTKYVWTEPENLSFYVNDGTHNRAPSLTADQLCLIVEGDTPGYSDVIEFRRTAVEQPWGKPIFCTGSDFEDRPSISSDGLQVVFNSNGLKAPEYVGGHDLFLRRRPSRTEPWGPPEHLGPQINTSNDEAGAALSPNGLLLAFFSNRPDGMGSNDIWIARRSSPSAPFGPPQNLGRTINSGGNDANPHFLDDAGTLLFDRDGTLFVTFKNASGAVGAISLPNQLEPYRDPWLSPDGSNLYFNADNRRGGLGGTDIWMTRRVPRDSPEAKRIPPPPELPPPPKIEAVVFQNHAYQWVRDPALTWYDAERIAQSMGGKLVAITSQEESDWIHSKLVSELPAERMIWIGGLKEADGVWKWPDGSPLTFVAWHLNEGGDGATAGMGISQREGNFGWADWPAASTAVAQSGPIQGISRCVGLIVEWDVPNPTLPPRTAPAP